ncbi:SDR family NAD(P)-dependent oxidoreductase [Methylibium petroleiphilum]|uniref:SDR family NAD(P)-dependent oxidoreductase n=1 Tax=Methylibium petroleiphilum TaxID=105560 RepID=UPI001AC1CA43|nr:SDR family oxidoreductase [Methylibium petroleiphilum]MBN9205968.1 SDR family oxidoreductase [Methylibium petroleiphilum]
MKTSSVNSVDGVTGRDLENKVALVTGGSRGMGAAIARALAARGASIAVTYLSSSTAAQQVVAEAAHFGVVAIAVQADHRDDASTARAVLAVAERFGRIDIVVNNAGVFPFGPIEDMSLELIDQTLATHARAPYRLVQAALPSMPAGGRIVSIGSSLGTHIPSSGVTLYAMSKAALVGFTKALARELGPRGITVNLVNPGSIDTDMNPADGPQAEDERPRIPLGRYGRADEIANVVAFLVSPAAAYVSGAVLAADGGATA